MRAVRQRRTDYTNLTEVDHLVRALVMGEVDRDEARSRLGSITSSGHRYPRWAVTLGWGVMAVGAAMFLGGDWIVCVIAFAVAMVIDAMQREMTERRLPTFYQQVAGALLASLVAVGVAAVDIPVDPSLVVTAGIIMLLAGIAFVGAVQDALTSFYVTSGARGLEALLLTGGITAGVSGGLAVADKAGVDVVLRPFTPEWNDLPVALIGSASDGGRVRLRVVRTGAGARPDRRGRGARAVHLPVHGAGGVRPGVGVRGRCRRHRCRRVLRRGTLPGPVARRHRLRDHTAASRAVDLHRAST